MMESRTVCWAVVPRDQAVKNTFQNEQSSSEAAAAAGAGADLVPIQVLCWFRLECRTGAELVSGCQVIVQVIS